MYLQYFHLKTFAASENHIQENMKKKSHNKIMVIWCGTMLIGNFLPIFWRGLLPACSG
jgi:hypothetical protein